MVNNLKTSSREILQNLLDTSKESKGQLLLSQILKTERQCAVSFLKNVHPTQLLEQSRPADTVIDIGDDFVAILQPGFRYTQAAHFLSSLNDSEGESITSHTFSTPEDGTIFDDLYSIAQQKISDGTSSFEETAPFEVDPSSLSILIADEDLAMLSILKGAFVSRGYQVKVFTKGCDLLSFAQDDLPDLLLLSDDLQDMKGLDLVERFRDRVGMELPILFLTSGDADEISIEAFRHGASDCVQKPVNLSALLERTSHFLSVKP